MAMRTLLSALTLAACGIFSLAASGAEKKDLTVVPEAFKEKVPRSRNWTQRTNPLFALSAEGVDDIHLAYEGESAPVLVLSNKTDEVLSLRGAVRVSGFGGTSFSLEASGDLAPHGCRRLPIGRTLVKGPWLAEAALETETAKAVAETRFAVVRRRMVTPPAAPGVFRAGFNYHMARYTDTDNEKCLKALVQAGAKIVRASIGAGFISVQPKEGVFNWGKPDRYLELLELHGLAVNTIIYNTPKWAMDDRHRNAEDVPALWASPARPGIYRSFCEKIAARYGTRIAWYEAGNELDLIRPERLSTDEAIAIQREVYEGVKAGCPAAKVIPNGWAVVHSDVIPHRTQRNMQERLMTEARAFCDAHTVHQHGPYREYRRRLAEFFAWRKARGIDGMHWYSNETAQTVTGAGETRVAECVWQKILFAWAHGSVDYIWYNLRASGFGPFDGEQGYGVMTGDFYPRATFTAFAGLTSCFEGLRPQECVHEGPSREVYRFAGVRGGQPVQVLVGWDLRAQTNVTIRVRTDAARAFAVDLFDNRRALPVQDGCVVLTFGPTPAAVLLEDVTSAIPDPSDLERGEKPGIQLIALGSQPHCFRLHDYDSVFEMYKADPLHFDRIWKGWNDLIATVRIRRDAGSLKIVAETRDEKLAAADRLVIIVDGVETRFPLEKPIESGGRYVGQIDFPKPDAILEIRIEDDDGQGKEGWVTTGPFKVH